MANLISIFLTVFLFTLYKFSILSSAAAMAKDQVGCSMCSSCENPCQLPPPSPPPPSPPQCPPPPAPPSCQACVYSPPPPQYSVQPFPPADDGGQFPGIAPPPPNPILPYYPYYYYNPPPSGSGKSVGFSWKIWPLGSLIIICLSNSDLH